MNLEYHFFKKSELSTEHLYTFLIYLLEGFSKISME